MEDIKHLIDEVKGQICLDEKDIELPPDYYSNSKNLVVEDTKDVGPDDSTQSLKTFTGYEENEVSEIKSFDGQNRDANNSTFENSSQGEVEKATTRKKNKTLKGMDMNYIPSNCQEIFPNDPFMPFNEMEFHNSYRPNFFEEVTRGKTLTSKECLTIKSCEEEENDQLLNDFIDEAIGKYEKRNDFQSKRFKEVSVQTVSDSSFVLQATNELNDECPLRKKVKLKEYEYSFLSYRNSHCVEDFTGEEQVSENNDSILSFLKPSSKIRVGLSKRSKPRPLHKKLIF